MDRPIQIFSRHHDNLRKLQGTEDAPFIKMVSIDGQLYDHFGPKMLKENMKKYGIANAYLLADESDIPKIKALHKADAIGLVLAADVKLHNKLPQIIRQSSCPCDADERSYIASCKQCALSQNGCFMAFAAKGFDKTGKIWDLMDPQKPQEVYPFTMFLKNVKGPRKGNLIAMSYGQVAHDIVGKSIELVNLYIRNFKEGKSSYIPLKDIRYPDDVEKATTVEAAETYKENLKGIQKEIKKGTFDLPGGEILPPVKYDKGKLVRYRRAMEFNETAATTQVGSTTGTYVKALDRLLSMHPDAASVLDYGAGLGKGFSTMKDGNPGLKVEAYEPFPERWTGDHPVTYTDPKDIKDQYDIIINPNVLNVLEPDVRDWVVQDIASKLAPGGKAFISVRGYKGDVAKAKNSRPADEDKAIWINRKQNGQEVEVYQKGFDGNDLLDYVQGLLPNLQVEKTSGIGPSAVIITKPIEVADKGINVRNEKNTKYADLIVEGKKTLESRETNSLKPYIGQRVQIIRTGEGKAKSIGSVTVGEPIHVTDQGQWDALRPQHMVPKGSQFDFQGSKYLYPMLDPQRYDTDHPVDSKGIVARKVTPRYRLDKTRRDHLVSHIGPSDGKKTVNLLKMGVLDKITTQVADSLHPLKKLEQLAGKAIPAELSGHKAFHMLSNFPAMLGQFLHYGRVMFKDNWISVTQDKEGGLYNVIEDLGDKGDAFFKWLTALSAQEMVDKGRKNIFGQDKETGEYIDDQEMIQALMDDTSAMYTTNKAQFDKARARLRDINKSVLDFAEAAGIIDSDRRAEWERFDYIPFFRTFEDWTDGSIEQLFPKGGPDVGQFHSLQGSKRNVGDPMSNLINSYSYVLNESLKNVARKRSMGLAKQLGMLTPIQNTPAEFRPKNALNIRVKGKSQWFKVEDPMLYDALVEIDEVTKGALPSWLSIPKRALTYGVTFAPGFRVANLFRDTLQTAVMQGSFVPFVDSAKGFVHAITKSDQYKEFAATGGSFSGAYHERDTSANTAKEVNKLKRRLRKTGKAKYMNPLKWWNYLGEASENAARLGLYMKLRNEGKSEFEAGYEAKDLLDFHRSGKATALKWLTALIPFLNARIQGLHKVGRSAMDTQTRKNFWIKGLLLGTLATALHLWNDDDDRYRDLPDHDRMMYAHMFDVPGLGHVKLPVPFEVGSMFMVWPQAMLEAMKGDRDNAGEFTYRILRDTFAIDWQIQPLKPIIHQFANKDSFTGVPIVDPYLEQLDPDLQYGQRTSKTARAIGKALETFEFLPPEMQSPKRIDKLAQDYFGYMANLTTYWTDTLLFNRFYPENPAANIGDRYISGLGRFVKGEDEVMRTIKAKVDFYDTLKAVQRKYKSMNAHAKFGNRDQLTRMFHESSDSSNCRSKNLVQK